MTRYSTYSYRGIHSPSYIPYASDYMIEKFARQAKGMEWSEADRMKFDTSDTETRFTQ